MLSQQKQTVKVPQKLGIKLSVVAQELSTPNETLIANIKRPLTHRLHLKAFKIGAEGIQGVLGGFS